MQERRERGRRVTHMIVDGNVIAALSLIGPLTCGNAAEIGNQPPAIMGNLAIQFAQLY